MVMIVIKMMTVLLSMVEVGIMTRKMMMMVITVIIMTVKAPDFDGKIMVILMVQMGMKIMVMIKIAGPYP